MPRWALVFLTFVTAIPGTAQILEQSLAKDAVKADPGSSLAHLRLGEALLKERNFQAAAIEFNTATLGDLEPAWTLVWSHIDLGRALDATGQRDRAVKEYQRALDTQDNTFAALGFASMYLWKAPEPEGISPLPGDPDNVANPKILTRVEPKYPPEALLARLEGSVLLSVSLSREGAVTDVNVLGSLGLGLDEAAIDAVRQWTFGSGTVRSEATPVAMKVPVQFRLPGHLPGWHVTKIEFAKPGNATRPVFLRIGPFAPDKMSPELAEEASIDAAISRVPGVAVSMEIDTLGNPAKIQINAASLPIWGDDAVRAISEWRFAPGSQSGTAIAVPCVVELGWFAPR